MLLEGIQSKQTGPLKDYGCFFLCVCKYAELQEGIEVTGIEGLWDLAHACGYINADHNIVMHSDLYRLVSGGIERKYFKRPSLSKCTTGIQIRELHKPGYTHFVLVSLKLEGESAIWDPLDPTRPAAADYKTIVSYREFI